MPPLLSSKPHECQGCGKTFPSRNAIFRHLKETNGACLSLKDSKAFEEFFQNHVKCVILYGYLADGEEAAQKVAQVIKAADTSKVNRSYGNHCRAVEMCAQDAGTGAITEVMATKLLPLANNNVGEWMDDINAQLEAHNIRILGRRNMPLKKFNAEMDVTHRRVDYLMPADFLCPIDFFRALKNFRPNYNPHLCNDEEETMHPETLQYLCDLKRTMQLLTTHIVALDRQDPEAVLAKTIHAQKRKHQCRRKANKNRSKREDKSTSETPIFKGGKNVLKRRRFHNFSPKAMAHEFLAYRRLDRFFHRATIRFNDDRPYFLLSLKGDLFLNGQVCRVIGLFIALARKLIDPEFVDCVFDEKYPHLVPVLAAPSLGMLAAEASYISTEGKVQAILSPRQCSRYSEGWNDDSTLKRVREWEEYLHQITAERWLKGGVDEEGRLMIERKWTREVLEPWAERARMQLEDYRQWKQIQKKSPLPSLSSLDSSVPAIYAKVLDLLRKADSSGLWPTTTPKRQMVMVSTSTDNDVKEESLSLAHMKARSNKQADRASAYTFVQGQGGASGSFSVGAMPGINCLQPKGNTLFPELMKAAFELEIALYPERASSTIAINRNAQFRPHVDVGAGAGQSTSLIVGLGNYVGGELMVEGEQKDIRYKALEFDGWKQRHWTNPFEGERYSLVWFTPNGCEGVRGIDLCK